VSWPGRYHLVDDAPVSTPEHPSIAGIVLAAGAGTRFGGPVKQLHDVGGRPMLERVLATMAGAELDELIVVLGANAEQVLDGVDLHGARPVISTRWADGQAASLQDALAATGAGAALIVLGDGPELSGEAVRRVAAAGDAAAADYGSGRSHPVLLPRTVWPSLPRRGETPGRGVPVRLVDCSDLPPPGDVDYPD
jgi:CTP:molybdopterin cytidylyltransferase MocA